MSTTTSPAPSPTTQRKAGRSYRIRKSRTLVETTLLGPTPGRWPGQVPTAHRAREAASATGHAWHDVGEKAGPCTTAKSVVAGLGLDRAAASSWEKYLRDTVSGNELSFRRAIFDKAHGEMRDPAQRRALFMRAMSYHAEMRKGFSDLEPGVLPGAAAALYTHAPGARRQLTVSVGPRGGRIVGRTSSGKPIYDAGNHPEHRSFTAGEHRQAQKVLEHQAARTHHFAVGNENRPIQFGDDLYHRYHDLKDAAEWHGKQRRRKGRARLQARQAGDPAALGKAEARGGKYHRRVPREGGGYRYFYDEAKYAEREDAHVSGSEARKAKMRRELMSAVGHGCDAHDLKPLAKRYSAKEVSDLVKECVSGGHLEHSGGGKLRPRNIES